MDSNQTIIRRAVSESSSLVRAREAFARMREEMERVEESLIDRQRASDVTSMGTDVDVHAATLAASELIRFVGQQGVYEHMNRLLRAATRRSLDEYIARLEDASWAARYARTRYRAAAASRFGSGLPSELLDRATELRGRMALTLMFNASNGASVANALAASEPGHGYSSLPAALLQLAALYQLNGRALRREQHGYRDEDEDRARRLAREIHDMLENNSKQTAHWMEMQTRAYIVLSEAYNGMRRLVAFGFPEQPELLSQFPELPALPMRATPADDDAYGATGRA